MKYVAYLGETVLTSDGVGDAVLDYARALVAEQAADVVDIPVLVDHTQSVASMLIGPGSPLMLLEVEDRDEPLEDQSAIEQINAKKSALGPRRALPSDTLVADDRVLSFDYLL